MEIKWGNKFEDKEDADKEASEKDERGYIKSAIQKAMESGQFDNLPGKGKPLNLEPPSEHSMANRIMKNANVLPLWLELQHEIRDEIAALIEGRGDNIAKSLDEINAKIKTFNLKCPSVSLQKPLLHANDLDKQFHRWWA